MSWWVAHCPRSMCNWFTRWARQSWLSSRSRFWNVSGQAATVSMVAWNLPIFNATRGVLWQTRLWKTNQRVVEDSGVPTNTEAKTPGTRMIRSSTRKVLRLCRLVVSGSNTSGDWSMQRCHDRTATSDSRITRRSLSECENSNFSCSCPAGHV